MSKINSEKIHVLCIEDDEADFLVIDRILSRSIREDQTEKYETSRATSLFNGLSFLTDTPVDLILLDLTLPDCTNLEGLQTIHDKFPLIPIIMLTGLNDEDIAVDALYHGAQDYLVKGESINTLPRAIRYAIERHQIFRELEKARLQAQEASRAKSAFLANMSHEIRTPLTSILGFAETISGPNLSEEQQQSLATIIKNSDHLLNIINDILDISKVEAGKLDVSIETISLQNFLSDIEKAMRVRVAEKNILFSLEHKFPLPKTIQSDITRLKQIIYNIVGNAIKFTSHGSVTVNVSCNPLEEQIYFKVIDTGIGLSPAEQEKLFYAFSQADTNTNRKYGGTGLGLIISKQLAEKLGGTITLESEKDKGSSFTIVVSTGSLSDVEMVKEFDISQQTDKHILTLHQKTPKLSGKVLIAEDCEDTQQLIDIILRNTDVDAEKAYNGKEAIEAAIATEFDLILMDMQMPVMDGYTAAKHIREKGFKGPIIAFTANAIKGIEERCNSFDCNGFLQKPFRKKEFFNVMSQYLGESNGGLTEESLSERTEIIPEISEIVQEDPSLAPAVLRFVINLPTRLESVENAYRKKDWADLKFHAHKLAGAGSFGYGELSGYALALEDAAANVDVGKIDLLMQQIKDSCLRVEAGKEELESLVN